MPFFKSFAKFIIGKINSTDKINTINSKTEMFIEENGEKMLIRFIEFERGKHSGSDSSFNVDSDEFKDFQVAEEGAIEYATQNKKKYILKRVGSKQLAVD